MYPIFEVSGVKTMLGKPIAHDLGLLCVDFGLTALGSLCFLAFQLP